MTRKVTQALGPARSLVLLRGSVLVGCAYVAIHLLRWEILATMEFFSLWILISLQACIFLFFLTFFRRWLTAVVAWLLGVEFFRAMSGMKLRYLATPIDASDLRQFDAGSIFQTLVNYPAIVLWVVAGVVILFGGVILVRPVGGVVGPRWRVMAFAMACLLVAAQYEVRRELSVRADAMNSTSLSAFLQSFFLEEADLSVDSVVPLAVDVTCPAHPANIAVVLQESTFKSAAAVASDDPNLKDFFGGDVYSGPMRVHVFGGKTHLSDFAFLVGLPHLAMAGAKEYLSRTLAGRVNLSLPQVLKRCGYESSVIYPISKGYFNSYGWFKSVGFDNVLAPEDTGLSGPNRWKMPDDRFYDAALRVVRAKTKPQLVYILTIAQHGPHDLQGDPSIEYQRRLIASAKAFGSFQQSLKAQGAERPWLLAWFGDHRPFRVDGADIANRYVTWASVRWVGQVSARPQVPVQASTDIAFLSRLIQRAIGVQSGYLGEIEDQMMEACPRGYFDCPNELRQQHQVALRAAGAIAPPK